MARPRRPAPGLWLCLGLGARGCEGLRAGAGAGGQWYDPANDVLSPEGPAQQPLGRHIQFLWMNRPHGLTDRIIKYFRPLVALGSYHNATVHINGGSYGAALWLDRTHSEEVSPYWRRYFDIQVNGGNPWHELVNFSGCKTLNMSKHLENPWKMFDDGSLCVNIISEIGMPFRPERVGKKAWDLPVSGNVKRAAAQFLERYGVDEAYGSVHIRRCDRLLLNQHCTDPDRIRALVAEASELKTWLFFMYAEDGYRQALRARLEPLGVRLLFEDEVVLNDMFPEDNYFTYLLGKYIHGGAQTVVETHQCTGGGPNPQVLSGSDVKSHGIFLNRNTREDEVEDGYLAAEEQYAAVCSNKTKGAKLLPHKSRDARKAA